MEKSDQICNNFLNFFEGNVSNNKNKNKNKSKGEQTIMSNTIETPVLTENKEINVQLIKYFWVLIGLTFASQVISYAIQLINTAIDFRVFGILCLGAINTLLIGGAVKMVQQQMYSVTDRYNKMVGEQLQLSDYIDQQQRTNEEISSKLISYEAELINLRVENAKLKDITSNSSNINSKE